MMDNLGIDISWTIVFLLVVAGFLAGFIDSIVGGGGLVSVPALLLTGLPPSIALGTNKGASVVAAVTSSYIFYKSGKVDWPLVKIQLPFTLLGSVLGTLLVVSIPPLYLKPILIVLLTAVLIFVIVKKTWGKEDHFAGTTTKTLILCMVFAFFIGMYDGFIGPGTGTFLIIAFIITGFDFLKAAGNAKILNFASNFGSLVVFLLLGRVQIWLSLAMALGQFLGASLGARLAIARGSSLVRVLLIVTTTCMIIKLAYDYIQTW